jgi:hypothetical protein
MHLDPAFVRDAFAIAFGHREVRSGEKIAVIDGLLAWEPDIGQQVGISNVYQAIYQIHGSRPLTKITSDHYNPETVQRLKMTGLNASIITFSQTKQLEIYDFARKLLHENRLVLPKDSPWSNKLKEEMFGIQLIKNRKIDHRKDGCFTAETRIPLLDGTQPTIAELQNREVWVYSCKPDGTIVPGRAKGRKTKEVTHLLNVVLDTEAVVRCTPEHLFMTRTGNYIQAKDIAPGITCLMPVKPNKEYKVKSIIPVTLDSPVPVYDLEVDEWDNFALAADIIVHNSKDICDAVAVVAWHLMSDLSSAIQGTAIRSESKEAKLLPGDPNLDIAFAGAGRELASQIKTAYKGWGTSRNDGGSWSSDDYF